MSAVFICRSRLMPTPTRTLVKRSLILGVAALFLAASQADARAGRGGGFGSRGGRTWSAPAPTTTAPRQAAPIQRSVQQPGPAAQRPLGQQARPGGFFSTRGGFMGGLIGAGLIGMFLGYGLFGGLGGLGSIIGLLLQVALVVFLVRLAFRYFQRRAQPALAGGPPAGAGTFHREAATARTTTGSGGGASGQGGAPARGRDQVGVTQADLDAFERLLGEVEAAYAAEDVDRLRAVATPEVTSYLAEELGGNAQRGVVNHVADVKLLQGDLAESWREGAAEYATVAMRFAHRDWTVERATGRVVEGDPERPTEATEVWTFRRERGGSWALSAIQAA